MNGWRIPPHHMAAAAFAVVAGIGWWRHSTPLALLGVAGLLATWGTALWQRHCLTGVHYRRSLGHDRALFGEEVPFDVELVNDKLLPLTWLHVEDTFPLRLGLQGGTVVPGRSDLYRTLVEVLPLLPYQRVRRHMTITCNQRGVHTIGPAEVTSGDPLGYRRRSDRVPDKLELLVYPKIFTLAPPVVASRMPLGREVATALPGDPSRVVGVREYRPGDPLRHVDWRASARSTTLLVREMEPTASPRLAVFADLRLPKSTGPARAASLLEFTIAVTASLLADLDARGIGISLHTTGSVPPRTPGVATGAPPPGLSGMLEHLARLSPYGGPEFGTLLATEGARLPATTSVVAVSAELGEEALVALVGLRRRTRVTAVWVDGGGTPLPPERFDANFRALYTDDWQDRDILELAP